MPEKALLVSLKTLQDEVLCLGFMNPLMLNARWHVCFSFWEEGLWPLVDFDLEKINTAMELPWSKAIWLIS